MMLHNETEVICSHFNGFNALEDTDTNRLFLTLPHELPKNILRVLLKSKIDWIRDRKLWAGPIPAESAEFLSNLEEMVEAANASNVQGKWDSEAQMTAAFC